MILLPFLTITEVHDLDILSHSKKKKKTFNVGILSDSNKIFPTFHVLTVLEILSY